MNTYKRTRELLSESTSNQLWIKYKTLNKVILVADCVLASEVLLLAMIRQELLRRGYTIKDVRELQIFGRDGERKLDLL